MSRAKLEGIGKRNTPRNRFAPAPVVTGTPPAPATKERAPAPRDRAIEPRPPIWESQRASIRRAAKLILA